MVRWQKLSVAALGVLLLTAQAPTLTTVQDLEQACRKGIADVEAGLPKVTDVRNKRKAEGELREMKRALEDKQWADCMDALDEAKEAMGA